MTGAGAAGRVIDPIPCSYRDPAGFVFCDGAVYKRIVTIRGEADYCYFISCGLYEELANAGLLVRHDEELLAGGGRWTRVLVPEQIPYVSYPYEWSFEQLRDAALVTLDIQARALARGMTLKDASAYNVQFAGSKPVFIDTLSFRRRDGGAWAAYEQFCRHFLGPLLLMSSRWPDAGRYLGVNAEGFPLEIASRLLPRTSYLRPGALLHIHLHARAIGRRAAAGRAEGRSADVARLVESLRRTIERLRPPTDDGCWTGYYAEARFYPPGSQESKRDAVTAALRRVRPALVYDLGANTGAYSREAAEMGALCVALDRDPACVGRLYLDERARGGTRILPLVVDLANPSPALGFGLEGTMSLFERPKADLALALALLHHLRVTCNLPFEKIVPLLARLARWVLAEFIPFDDPAVGVLTSRTQDFEDYTLPAYLDAFARRFRLHASWPVAGTGRVLHLFEAAP